MKKFLAFVFLVSIFLSAPVFGATYSDFVSGDMSLSRPALTPVHEYVPFIHYRQFDFGNDGLNGGTGVTNGDVVKLFNVPANTYITEIGIRVTTAALKSGTSGEIGDGADIDGFVGNDITTNRIPFVDLSNTTTGVSAWKLCGPFMDGTNDGGSTTFTLSGTSITILSPGSGTGVTVFGGLLLASNNGPYFTDDSGGSPYITPDTIDMTVYVDKSFDPGSSTGVTPVFECYIKGFRRVTEE